MKLVRFEKVRVAANSRLPKFVGQVGVVVGIGEDEGKGYSYAVSMGPSGQVVSFWETELEGTGEVVDPGSLYDGDSVRVVVKNGKGELA